MEDRQYAIIFQMLNEDCAFLQVRQNQIEHMGIVGGILRYIRQTKTTFVRKWFEQFVLY